MRVISIIYTQRLILYFLVVVLSGKHAFFCSARVYCRKSEFTCPLEMTSLRNIVVLSCENDLKRDFSSTANGFDHNLSTTINPMQRAKRITVAMIYLVVVVASQSFVARSVLCLIVSEKIEKWSYSRFPLANCRCR